jgi:hypothetical protein
MFKKNLKDVMEILRKLQVDPEKIDINKREFFEIIEQAKNIAYDQMLKNKT